MSNRYPRTAIFPEQVELTYWPEIPVEAIGVCGVPLDYATCEKVEPEVCPEDWADEESNATLMGWYVDDTAFQEVVEQRAFEQGMEQLPEGL